MSTGTATKKALCVGINDYPGTGNDLSGCVNDAKDWKSELERRGYAVTLLLDGQATRAKMGEELVRLVQDASAGDSLVFTFSGHGSWLPDDDSDEVDGRDEMLCPHDIFQNHYLLDDDLAEIFGRKPPGVQLYFISDSCHSGTVAKFAPLLFPGTTEHQARPRLLHPETFVKSREELARIRRVSILPGRTPQKYPALLAAACRDPELSWDAWFNGRPNGAFTRVALDALKKNPTTPKAWMTEIRTKLPAANYPQTPSLYGSRTAKRGPIF